MSASPLGYCWSAGIPNSSGYFPFVSLRATRPQGHSAEKIGQLLLKLLKIIKVKRDPAHFAWPLWPFLAPFGPPQTGTTTLHAF
jgi:hypothetical protein